jgi:hypothetical protein
MTTITQRTMECSLASLCAYNGLSQSLYEAMSDLAAKRGARYVTSDRRVLRKAIAIGKAIVKEFGFAMPQGYESRSFADGGNRALELDFSGKGIVRIAILPKRCRSRWIYHVLAFENNTFFDTENAPVKGWSTYAKLMKAKHGHQAVKPVTIYPSK